MPLHRRFRCGVAWTPALVALAAAGWAEDHNALVAQVQVLPRHNQWTLVDPAQQPVLRGLLDMPGAERQALLESSDARLRGIGIFVAEQQGDLETLLSLSAWLTDDRPTAPYALPLAQPGAYTSRPQGLGEYLTTVYQEWCGVDVDRSRERFAELLEPMQTQAQLMVHPWVVRLRRAAQDPAALQAVKAQVAALPEEVRWAVVTLGHQDSRYTREEARALLGALSAPVRAQLQSRAVLPQHEPLFRASTSLHETVLRQYAALIGS